jgi:hypothetical protein
MWSFFSGLENREYGRKDPLRWPRDTLYPQKLAPTSPTSGGRSFGIVRSRTNATEFLLREASSLVLWAVTYDWLPFMSWQPTLKHLLPSVGEIQT